MADAKKRHGCLTAWLVLMIVGDSFSALMYLLGSGMIRKGLPNFPAWAMFALILFSVFNLVCAIALFQWRKWGFWGCCASSVVVLFVNLSIGIGTGQCLLGLVGVLILYAVLQIGAEDKGWSQLE
jgi:hypothetical protein